MKKEDAKYIIDFLDWIVDNMTISEVDYEYFGNRMMNSFNLLREVVSDVNMSDLPKENKNTMIELCDRFIKLTTPEKPCTSHSVRKSLAKEYAEFCVRCDIEGLPLLELDDYIKFYC